MPHGAKPGHKKVGGRAKGSRNRATIERELIAADIVRRQMSSRAHAPEGGRELAVEKLERYGKLAEGATEFWRPELDDVGKPVEEMKKPHANWTEFREWLKFTVFVYKELAQYQSPKMSVVAVAPTPITDESGRTKTFTLTVFEGGKALGPSIVDGKALGPSIVDVTPKKPNGG